MYGDVWRHWWFWVSAPFVLVAVRYLNRGLTAYCAHYWQSRGQEPPERRYSWRFDAGSLVIYSTLGVILAIGLAVEKSYLWSVVAAIASVGLSRFALVRARENVIGWTRSDDD